MMKESSCRTATDAPLSQQDATRAPIFIHTGGLCPDSDANRELYGKMKHAHVYCEHRSWGGSMHTNNTWQPFSSVGEPNEYGNVIEQEVMKGMRDCLAYDLRRDKLYE